MSLYGLLRAALTVQVLLGLARFVAPYAGLSVLATLLGIASGLGVVVAHMALGLAAIKVIDVAVEEQRASQRSAVLVG